MYTQQNMRRTKVVYFQIYVTTVFASNNINNRKNTKKILNSQISVNEFKNTVKDSRRKNKIKIFEGKT